MAGTRTKSPLSMVIGACSAIERGSKEDRINKGPKTALAIPGGCGDNID